jgi:hypothetical protein
MSLDGWFQLPGLLAVHPIRQFSFSHSEQRCIIVFAVKPGCIGADFDRAWVILMHP